MTYKEIVEELEYGPLKAKLVDGTSYYLLEERDGMFVATFFPCGGREYLIEYGEILGFEDYC